MTLEYYHTVTCDTGQWHRSGTEVTLEYYYAVTRDTGQWQRSRKEATLEYYHTVTCDTRKWHIPGRQVTLEYYNTVTCDTGKQHIPAGLPICYLSRGYLRPLLDGFTGYFHPLFINLEGITLCSELLALHKPWLKTKTLILNVVFVILTVKCNAHGFLQSYNFLNQKIIMLENTGYIPELTAWHCYQGHMKVWRGGNRSRFFRLTHHTKF